MRVELLRSFVYDSFLVWLLQSNHVPFLSSLYSHVFKCIGWEIAFSPLCWKCRGVVLLLEARKETSGIRLSSVFMILGILKSSQIIHAIDYSFKCKHGTLYCYFQLDQLWSLGLSQILTFLLPPWGSWFILKPNCRISSLGSSFWSFRLTRGSRRISKGRGLKSNGYPHMTL